MKIEILKKEKSLDIWWTGSCPQNLGSARAGVSEKPESTDDGRQRHDSNSADKVMLS